MNWNEYYKDMAKRWGWTEEDMIRIDAQMARQDQEELARLREQYSGWTGPHRVYCTINATPADILNPLDDFKGIHPQFPQDPTVATWGGLGLDGYPTANRRGGAEDGYVWRCVPLPYGATEPEPGTLPVSTVRIKAILLTAAPARSRVELELEGPHLGRWYEALQAFVLENYPEAGAWRRVHPATAGSTSSTTHPEPPSGESAAVATQPVGEEEQKPAWVPKRSTVLAQWSSAYRIISDMRKEATDPENWLADSLPALEDYRERLGQKMNWKPSTKTVGRILHAGDSGWLSKRKRQ